MELLSPSILDYILLDSMVRRFSPIKSTCTLHFLQLYTVAPTIADLMYEEGNDTTLNHTLTCVSTGSPPTNVSWIKDGVPLTSDYIISQNVTERRASTYDNVLTVRPEGAAGTYNCTVSNVLGSDSMVLMAVGE